MASPCIRREFPYALVRLLQRTLPGESPSERRLRVSFSRSYIDNSLHLARKYATIFVRGHYLFREANIFPRAQLEENCSLLGTDSVQGQISEHIFATNGGYRPYYPSNPFSQRVQF